MGIIKTAMTKKVNICSNVCEHDEKVTPDYDTGSFKEFVRSLLKRGKIKDRFINSLLTDDCLKLYEQAFTHKSVSESNYELFEMKGDVLVNAFFVWYLPQRFPQLNRPEGVPIIAPVKCKYVSTEILSEISQKLGMEKYLSVCTQTNTHIRNNLLEDLLESFCGVTAHILDQKYMIGVGYNIVYDFLKSLYDDIDISLKYEDVYSHVTIFKETVDKYNISENAKNTKRAGYKKYTDIRYDPAPHPPGTTSKLLVLTVFDNDINQRILMGTGKGSIKVKAQKAAALNGIQYFEEQHQFTYVPEYWSSVIRRRV